MNFKSYQEDDVPNKDAASAAAATEKSSLTVGNDREESKSKLKLELKRGQTTPGIVASIVVAIMLFVVVVSSSSSLHGIRGTDSGGGGDASIVTLHQYHDPMCPTSGSPNNNNYNPHTDGSTQTPGVVFFGLDFSIGSYRGFRVPTNGGWTGWDRVWQDCALECNDDTACRTFTIHVKKWNTDGTKHFGDCYLHNHWLDNYGTRYEKKSLNNRSIVSGVCRPEDRWDGYK